MLTVDELVPEFLARCPRLKSDWDRHLEIWGDKERGTFNDMAVIAHYLVRCFENDQLDEFPIAFAVIERCFTDGDDRTQEAATGILEDIQNISSHREFGAHVFESWLGPQSQRAWNQLANAWRDVSSLADMVRKEKGNSPQSPSMPNLDEIEDPELRRMIEQLYRK